MYIYIYIHTYIHTYTHTHTLNHIKDPTLSCGIFLNERVLAGLGIRDKRLGFSGRELRPIALAK